MHVFFSCAVGRADGSRSPLRVGLSVLTAALLAAGCATDATVEIVASPDGRVVDAQIGRTDAYLDPDRGAPAPDLALGDVPVILPDLGSVDAAGDAAADAGQDALAPDAGPTPAPAAGEVAIIPQAADTWIAWTRDGQLFARCLKAEACKAPHVVAAVGPSPLAVRGIGTQAGIPWVVVNDAITNQAIAYDVKNLIAGQATPLPLGLYGAVALGVTGLQPRPEVVIAGRISPNPAASVGWRRVTNEARNALRDILVDFTGLPVPASIVALNDGAVFGFSTGQCLKLTTESSPDRVQPRGAWSCGLGPLRFLAGRVDSLFAVTRDAATQTLSLRRQTPGHTDDGADASARVALPGLAETWDTAWPRFDDGGLFRTTEGATTSLWLVRTRQAARFDLADPATAVGIAPVGAEFRLLSWDPLLATIVDTVVEPSATAIPPAYSPDRACGRLYPETCDARDNDCNARTDENLCCTGSGSHPVTAGIPPGGAVDELGSVGISDDGLLYLVRQDQDIVALRYPSDDSTRAPMTRRGQWSGYGRLLLSTTRRSNALVVAEAVPVPVVDAGLPPPPADAALAADAAVLTDAVAPADAALPPPDAQVEPVVRVDLLWLQGLSALPPVEAPCQPIIAARFHADAQSVRLYCETTAWDLPIGAASGTEVPYPAATTLRWMTRAPFGDASLTLVARGDDHALTLWRDDDLGGILLVEQPLPVVLNNLLPVERTLPIHIPGAGDATPVRIAADQSLEVLLPNDSVGWTRMTSATTPIAARIAENEAVAYTLGYTTSADDLDPRAGFFVHDLRAGGQPWGTPMNLGDAENPGLADVHTLAVAAYAPSPAGPDLPRIFRVMGAQFAIEGFSLGCTAR